MRCDTCLTLAAALAAAVPAAAAEAQLDRLAALHGIWASPSAEPWYGGYGTREFVFRDRRWSLTFTHALDATMTQRTFHFRTGDAWRLGAASPAVP